jgi:hypothetical protein
LPILITLARSGRRGPAMFQRWVLILNGIVSVVFGLGFVFAANAVLNLYGSMSMEPATDQLLGAAIIGLGLLNLLARDVEARDARRAIFLANFAYNAIALIVLLTGIAMIANTLAWSTIALTAVFTLAFGYLALGSLRTGTPAVSTAS